MQKEGQFSIGEIANLTGVTIRTLQYYDVIGLVPSRKETINRRRYYQEKDLTKLQQVLFYKSLGLPIKEIKVLVIDAVTNDQIAAVLQKQRNIFYEKLNGVKQNISFIDVCLTNIEKNEAPITGELIQLMISLNKDAFFEYQDIEYDKNTKEVFAQHFENAEDAIELYWNWKTLILQAVTHIFSGVDPKSEQGLEFAKKWMQMVAKSTDGNLELVEAHKTAYENRDKWPEEDRRLMEFADEFIDKAMEAYLSINEFKEVENDKDKELN